MRSMTTKMATRIQAALSGMAVATPIWVTHGQGLSVPSPSSSVGPTLRDSSDLYDRQLPVAAAEPGDQRVLPRGGAGSRTTAGVRGPERRELCGSALSERSAQRIVRPDYAG